MNIDLSTSRTDTLVGTSLVSVTVVTTAADRLEAAVACNAELRRRSRAKRWMSRQRDMLWTSLPVTAAAVACGLLVRRLISSPVTPYPPDWFLAWMPMMLFTAAWYALLQYVNPRVLCSLLRKMLPAASSGEGDRQTRVQVSECGIEAMCAARRLQAPRGPLDTAVETHDCFFVVLEDTSVSIPKRSLDEPTTVALTAALQSWGLRKAPTQPSLGLLLVTLTLVAAGFAVWQQLKPVIAHAAATGPVPGQATIHLKDRSIRLDGSRTDIDEETYRVYVIDGAMYDSVRGDIRHRVAHGRFVVGRHAPGNIPRPPTEELALVRAYPGNIPSAPADASVAVLADAGVLITWRDVVPGIDVLPESCAILRSYRDKVPPSIPEADQAQSLYRRNLLLQFCSPRLSPPELGDWLVAAAPAFYTEFNAAVRP